MEAAAFSAAWRAGHRDAQCGRLPDTTARVRDAAHRLGLAAPEARLRRVAANEERTLVEATTLYPDTLPALEALLRAPGIPLGLVSNASPAAEALLDSLGLRRFFAATAWSCRVGTLKPDPAIYRAACKALGVEPHRCLFVGDGNARELDGAQALGMLAVRITRIMSLPSYAAESSRAWDVAIDDLREVPQLLEAAGAGPGAPSR